MKMCLVTDPPVIRLFISLLEGEMITALKMLKIQMSTGWWKQTSAKN